VESLCAHRLYSSQIANLTPLLLKPNLGLPAEDSVLLAEDLGREEETLAQEDIDLLNEKIMWTKKE
jgi:hypothetical protein